VCFYALSLDASELVFDVFVLLTVSFVIVSVEVFELPRFKILFTFDIRNVAPCRGTFSEKLWCLKSA
jgi:hypothetical protein